MDAQVVDGMNGRLVDACVAEPQRDDRVVVRVAQAGDRAGTVADPDPTNSGKLINGTYALASPIQVKATNAANPSTAFAPVTGAANPVTLLSWPRSISSDAVTVEARDSVEDAEQLMVQRRVRRLFVLDEGDIVGVLSNDDVAAIHNQQSVEARQLQDRQHRAEHLLGQQRRGGAAGLVATASGRSRASPLGPRGSSVLPAISRARRSSCRSEATAVGWPAGKRVP